MAAGRIEILRRLRLTMLRWRVRFARAVLLPELSEQDSADLRRQVVDDGALTQGYILMCALSAGIATLGLLQSSTAVVIGAMLVSPLMSPIAALGFGFASLDGHRIREAARVVLVGAAIGILTGMLLTWLSPIRNATPEILARTEPTLLDLAVALLSGIAGGYATVRGKGGTAIGVAIATALMPPLATLGYGLATAQGAFALGASLLFLTNLSAIAFAFALIARLSGAARPLHRVEWKPRHVAAGLAAFAVLAAPLGLTLHKITREATLRSAARNAIVTTISGKRANIAQLDVTWPMFGDPSVNSVVVVPTYSANANEKVRSLLSSREGRDVAVNLQQVVAADLPAQTRAMIDAAMERTVAGIAADVPPFERIRASIGLPTLGIWTNRSEKIVNVAPMAAAGWRLGDYQDAERLANRDLAGWTVRVIPPAVLQLSVDLRSAPTPVEAQSPVTGDAISPDLAVWALQRWGLGTVRIALPENAKGALLTNALDTAAISYRIVPMIGEPRPDSAIIEVAAPPPAARAAANRRAPSQSEP